MTVKQALKLTRYFSFAKRVTFDFRMQGKKGFSFFFIFSLKFIVDEQQHQIHIYLCIYRKNIRKYVYMI